MKDQLEKGYVHENCDGDTGGTATRTTKTFFYHWGGLLIALIGVGYMPAPDLLEHSRFKEVREIPTKQYELCHITPPTSTE